MAHQAKLEETVPTTLPDDFDEWDGGAAPPATLPDDFDEFDDAPAPPVSSSGPRAVVAAPPPGKSAEMPARRVSVATHVGTVPAPAQIAPPAPKQTKRGSTAAPQHTGTISLNLRGTPAAKALRSNLYSLLPHLLGCTRYRRPGTGRRFRSEASGRPASRGEQLKPPLVNTIGTRWIFGYRKRRSMECNSIMCF